jgi:hypothetical protein
MASSLHTCQNTVNIAKLSRTLKKQLQADPLKASALGIGCLVLLWFWLPLLRNMLPKARVAAASQHLEIPSPVTTHTTTAPRITKNWQQLAKLRGDDPLTRTSWVSAEQRDPFLPPWQVKMPKVEEVVNESTVSTQHNVLESQNDTKPENTETPPVEIPNLEIQVESILYGKHKRSAIINGKVVREGETVKLEKENDSEANSATCVVVSILPNMVIIEYKKHIYEAVIQRKGLHMADELHKISVDSLKN